MSLNALTGLVANAGAGLVGMPGVATILNSNKFDNTSGGMVAVIIIVVILIIALAIAALVATYRLTGSMLHVSLFLFFGCFYLFLAWVYYGMTGHKFVKVSKA